MQTFLNGPGDFWKSPDDTEEEDLGALGMHMTGATDDDKDTDLVEDDDEAVDGVAVVAAVATDEETANPEDDEVDDLKALDRLEKEMQEDKIVLGLDDSEDE